MKLADAMTIAEIQKAIYLQTSHRDISDMIRVALHPDKNNNTSLQTIHAYIALAEQLWKDFVAAIPEEQP